MAIEKELLDQWGISDYEVFPLKAGMVNSKWVVSSKKSRLVLRDTGSNPKYAEAQATLLDHLKASDFPYETPNLIPSLDNMKIVNRNGHSYYLYNFIDGVPITDKSDALTSFNVGRLVGEYTRSVSEVNLTKGSTFIHMLEMDALDVFLSLVKSSPWLDSSLESIARSLRKIYERDYGVLREMEYIPCHLDYNPGNILTSDSKKPNALIDFGSISTKPKICDVANALKNFWGIYGDCNDALIYSFFKGYSENQDLSDTEINLIYPIVIDELVREINWHTNRVRNGARREEVFLRERVRILELLIQTPRDFTTLI